MNHRYFIGSGPQAAALIETCKLKRERMAEAVKTIEKKYGGRPTFQPGKYPVLAYDTRPDGSDSWLVYRGYATFEVNGKHTVYNLYAPKKSSNKGKEIFADLLALMPLQFDAGNYICVETGMDVYALQAGEPEEYVDDAGDKFVRWKNALAEKSEAAYINGKIFVTAPVGNVPTDAAVAPPAWLSEVSAEEFKKEWVAQ